MNLTRKAVVEAWGAAEPNADSTIDMIVSTLAAEIEANKASVRSEYESLKAAYLRGAYRSAGYNKRECEDKLRQWNGQIVGFESALSTLYRAIDEEG